MDIRVLKTTPSGDYELIDSGDGEKLERYGSVILSRPDPQALWKKMLPESEWKNARARFSRDTKKDKSGWIIDEQVPKRWEITLNNLNFYIKPSSFKHTGLFPEQASNWSWIKDIIERSKKTKDELNVINFFGYTGGATLAASQAGAKVCHVDGSKVALTWARENADISGLKDRPIRWILDDAATFAERELKRDVRYDGIIMDPPVFGRGPDGQVWKIEENFIPFLDTCFNLLTDKPLFVLINGYASGYSALAYKNSLEILQKKYGGTIEIGELTIEESKSGRLLPAGIFARWTSLS
jgi:23S rRNA (cytosine1962-C5)-methyltransferase